VYSLNGLSHVLTESIVPVNSGHSQQETSVDRNLLDFLLPAKIDTVNRLQRKEISLQAIANRSQTGLRRQMPKNSKRTH
jgi:hypothetical protein